MHARDDLCEESDQAGDAAGIRDRPRDARCTFSGHYQAGMKGQLIVK